MSTGLYTKAMPKRNLPLRKPRTLQHTVAAFEDIVLLRALNGYVSQTKLIEPKWQRNKMFGSIRRAHLCTLMDHKNYASSIIEQYVLRSRKI